MTRCIARVSLAAAAVIAASCTSYRAAAPASVPPRSIVRIEFLEPSRVTFFAPRDSFRTTYDSVAVILGKLLEWNPDTTRIEVGSAALRNGRKLQLGSGTIATLPSSAVALRRERTNVGATVALVAVVGLLAVVAALSAAASGPWGPSGGGTYK